MTAVSTETNSMPTVAVAPLEKVPLETYVPPAKPSLIGLSRAEIADRLGQSGGAPDRLNDWADRETPTGSRLVTNVVMMGMGEPLYNFDAVRDALLIVADNEGIGISRRRITLSTSGVVPNIIRTGDEIGVMLAISLHAVRDELRNELVPLNRKYPIAELLHACRDYPGSSNARRI